MKHIDKNLISLIEAIDKSDIEPSVKAEIIKKLKSGNKEDLNQAVILAMEALNVACNVACNIWSLFPH